MKKTVQENKGVSAQAPGLATSARERHAHGRLRRWHLYWLTTLRGTGDGTPAHWSPTVQYLHGRDLSGTVDGAGGIGGLLGRSHGYSSGSWAYHNFYHSDGNGNVTALVNSGGTLQASYIYDPYGRYLSGTGTLLTSNVMRFSSKPWVSFLSSSATSGLYYYGYRFYDPYLQRWLSRDNMGEERGPNQYAFTRNSPATFADPDGRWILPVSIGILALWHGACAIVAADVGVEAFPGDDKKQHCMISCFHNRCTLLIQTPVTLLGGVVWEIASSVLFGGVFEWADLLANFEGIVNSFDLRQSCQDLCSDCPSK